jgi:hypothetical protein
LWWTTWEPMWLCSHTMIIIEPCSSCTHWIVQYEPERSRLFLSLRSMIPWR